MTGPGAEDEDSMTDIPANAAEPTEKKGKKGLVFGLILALAGAGGGFYLTASGLLPIGLSGSPEKPATDGKHKAPQALPDIAFVDLPPVIVSVNSGDSRHLKFHAQLEVDGDYAADVKKMLPRIIDVLNSYLRAVDLSDLEAPNALMRMRGHLLRRIAIVTGEGRVRDVLVMEFVLN